MKHNYRKEDHRQPIYISGVNANEYWQQFQYRK
jgi:hypothetical protein